MRMTKTVTFDLKLRGIIKHSSCHKCTNCQGPRCSSCWDITLWTAQPTFTASLLKPRDWSLRAHLHVVEFLSFMLAHSFLFFSCVHFRLYGPFKCISSHKGSQQLSTFSLCSSGLNSASLILSTIYPSLCESLPQPWCNPLCLAGLKALTH